MKERILAKLKEIEEQENIRILHCVESGSRAWGFASPDSDYDVRFIYVRPREFYLRLDKTRDVIEWQLDDTWDINGWDLSKALTLLHKSNATLFEWNLSPIVYQTTKEWERVSALINDYFVQKAGLYHYLSTPKAYRRPRRPRPLLACKWILAEGTPPPMLFCELMDKYLEAELKPEVARLLYLKMNKPEISEGPRFETINAYIERSISAIEATINRMPDKQAGSWDKLNQLFCSLLDS